MADADRPDDGRDEAPGGAAPGGPATGELARGDAVGRYTILARIGSGGMGDVFAAYDPELDRKVALKVMRAGSTDDARAQARLLREAKAMARLSHPNVVAVHDAGTFEGRVFIAMEFVDGATLSQWLAERPRTTDEIVAVFVRAARGLAAAHAAGLVHRDFKPGNLLIAKDGAVRVTDFGLARSLAAAGQGEGAEPEGAEPGDAGPGTADDLRLTRTGEVLGTPLYMAPEQFLGRDVDARADQFSFCVALYQALHGATPFGSDSVEGVRGRVLAGRVEPAPTKTAVPAWLRRVVLRGLSVEPAARWPSMEALVTALARDPARTRRRRALAAGALGLAALSALALARDARRPARLCLGGPARLAGAWELGAGTRRRAVEQAFLASPAPAAAEVWPRVAAQLDRYAGDWLAMYREACEATNVRREQPAALLDLRMTCLDERRTAVAALTDVLQRADREVVPHAVDAVRALPALARCASADELRAPVEPPRDASTRARVDELRPRMAPVRALSDAGKRAEARDRAGPLVADARRIGYRPLLAETLALLSATHVGGLEPYQREEDIEEAVWTSLASGRDDLAAETAVEMTYYTGWTRNDPVAHAAWSGVAKALLDRLPPGHELLRAWWLQDEGIALLARDPAAALPFFQEALAIKERVRGRNDPDTARTLSSIADTLHELGRNAEALPLVERASEVMERAYGPASEDVAMTLANRGEYLLELGRAAEAVPVLREGARVYATFVGDGNPNNGFPLTDLGRALVATGKPKEAVAVLARALALREKGESHAALIAETRFALARALQETGEGQRALALAARARREYVDEYDHDAPPADGSRAAARAAAKVAEIDAWLAARADGARPRRAETAPSSSVYDEGDGR